MRLLVAAGLALIAIVMSIVLGDRARQWNTAPSLVRVVYVTAIKLMELGVSRLLISAVS